MEFDQIPPPASSAGRRICRAAPTTNPRGIAFHHFVPAPAPCSAQPGWCCSVGVFRSVTYSLSRLDDLLALLFGETLHSSLARARGKEEGWQRFPFLAISFVCSSSIGDFLAYNVSNPYGISNVEPALPAIHPTSSCDSNK